MTSTAQEIALLAVVVAFAVNLGAHYTGATMGMPYASRSISLWPALTIVAVFALLGAALASGQVEKTVGQNLIPDRHVGADLAIVIVACGGLLTMAFNFRRLPTSTIQILVFCVIGAALAAGLSVRWATLLKLAIVWIAAPAVATMLGYLLTRALDRVVPPEAAAAQARSQLEDEPPPSRQIGGAVRLLPTALVLVGVFASFAMGSNDVANASGALVLVRLFATHAAGAIGGTGLFVGALVWGRRILERVAFDVVKLDLSMASAAQGVQALVVILAVSQGFFTSMNQALIAAMAGTGLARGRQTVNRAQLVGIFRGWLIGPACGLGLAYIAEKLLG